MSLENLEDEEQYREEEELIEVTEETVTVEGIEIKIPPGALNTIAESAAHRICTHLAESVKKLVEQRLDSILDDAWQASVQAMAQAAIDTYLTKPRSKTNSYGEPISGQTTMLSEQIPRTVESWLQAKVDAKGNEVDRSYSRDSYESRITFILRTLVTEQLATETKKAAADVTEKARAIVANHVGRFISEQMVPSIEAKG